MRNEPTATAASSGSAARPAATIRLTGGRGTVAGDIVHANPNYTYLLTPAGDEVRIPAELIAEVRR